ncbi:hypothetical protein FPG87_12800 [Flavobacterium psychrophilum]|uniref:hypothetical protein n=1 Tax=Flavobacterium psychrophilum TaxID=96345 RepID=UPI0009030FC9|nr:hypothetical protein [Flavobacterium psychrophilum]OJH14051.1 hypothetical protein FPG87_12800 [Flavobacterium psychrophilum]SNA79985.1 hypothetical protein DK150_470001 [Flavobacterium psychrophilum]
MSENINVSLSTFDRSVSVINTYNTYKNRKISEQILVQQAKSNAHLTDMKNQLKVANETNRKILENQIRQEELKEEQKFYKALSYNSNEIIEQFGKINDPMVLNYLINGFYEKTKISLLKANDTLEEINDKLFSKQILEKLNEIKEKAEINASVYSANILNNIDNLLNDLKQKEDELSNIKKNELKETKIRDKWKINPFRIFGIIFFGFCTFVNFVSFFISENSTTNLIANIVSFLIFAIPLFFLIKKERKWRKEFSEYKMLQNQKRLTEQNKVIEAEQEYQQEIQKHQEMLMQHPAFIAMQEINSKHPTFETMTTKISEIEKSFLNKWGISFENRNDGKVSEKVLKYIQKGEKLNAMKVYKDENNVSLNVARNYIDKISKDYKYKL